MDKKRLTWGEWLVKMNVLTTTTSEYGEVYTGTPKLDEEITPQWISVKDRLPDEEENMIHDFLLTDGEEYAVGFLRRDANNHWDNASFGWVENRRDGSGIGTVTHWMPLPELPEED